MNIVDAIKARTSVRAFTDKPVTTETITQILDAARFAPSDKNIQPWYVAVVTGETQQQLAQQLQALNQVRTPPNPDYVADTLSPFYKERAFACGAALYGALGIEHDDKARRLEQWNKNFRFFDAPVGLFFFTDNELGINSWVDCGMFMQNVMVAALEFGLATCPQRSLSAYPDTVRAVLGEKFANKKLISGMSLGYPDRAAPENNYRTARAEVAEFTEFFS